MGAWWQCFLCLCLLVSQASAYSGGPPNTATTCSNMVPQHPEGAAPQDLSTSPYTITFDNSITQYAPGQQIQVTLSGTSTFKGVLLQARKAADETVLLGEFSQIPSGLVTTCNSLAAVSHNSPVEKNNVVLTWTAPASAAGHVVFVATFVRTRPEYWVKVRSNQINDGVSPELVTSAPTTASQNTVINELDLSECGRTWSCYSQDCAGSTCTYAARWRPSPSSATQLEVELSIRGDQWAAIGFSRDTVMGADTVVACLASASAPELMYTTTKTSPTPAGCCGSVLSNGVVYAVDGNVRCTFTYDSAAVSGNNIYDLRDGSYYVFIGKGPTTSGVILRHQQNPPASPQTAQLHSSDFINLSGSAVNWLVKFHGAIMCLAWMACSSIGIILARYYKPMWANSKACGEKVWFQIHRSLMISTLLLTIIGTILIFVSVSQGGTIWSQEQDLPLKAHPILGIIAASLAVINPIMALFRCHPGDKHRPIFNWFHWFVGTVAYVFAGTAVIIGTQFQQAAVPSWLWVVALVYYILSFVFDVVLEVHQALTSKKNASFEPKDAPGAGPSNVQQGQAEPAKDKEDNIELRQAGEPEPHREPEYSGRGFKMAVLVIYVILTVIFTIVLVGVILGSS